LRGLLPLVVTTTETSAAAGGRTAIDFADEGPMQGAFSYACLRDSRTPLAPDTDEHFNEIEPEIEKIRKPRPPATALARSSCSCLGGPSQQPHLGILPSTAVKRSGVLRKSTDLSDSSMLGASNAGHITKVLPGCLGSI